MAIGTAAIVLGLGDDDDRVGALVDGAARLAAEHDSTVLVVHVVPRSELWTLAGLMIDSTSYLRAQRRRFEREALAPLRRAGIPARLLLRLGEPAHELASLAAATGADRIVIGAESHPRRHQLVGGGIAHRLAELSTVPVRVVESTVSAACGSGT